MSILDLRGPEFLQVYLALFAGAVVGGFVLRRLLRGPSTEQHPSRPVNLGALEVAYLSSGPRGATDAAIAALAHRNLVRVSGTPPRLRSHADARHADLTPPERAIYTATARAGASGVTVREARRSALAEAKALGGPLERLQLVLSPGTHALVRLMPTALMLAVLVLGAAKVYVGISRGRPVEYLIFLCIAAAVGAVLFAIRAPHRTVRGDRYLKKLRGEHAALQTNAAAAPERLHYSDMAMAFALFGPAALSHAEYSELRRAMQPVASGGSGCGGGSCGSGGGDGGGCGGGGCGGCGGGGD